MEAREFLKQIKKLDEMISNKKAEKRHWDGVANSLGGFSTGERVQATRNPHKMYDAVDQCIDLQREIDRLEAKRQAIINVIEKLPFDEYKVLYGIYVKRHLLKEIAADCQKSYAWAKKIHIKALENVQIILNTK